MSEKTENCTCGVPKNIHGTCCGFQNAMLTESDIKFANSDYCPKCGVKNGTKPT